MRKLCILVAAAALVTAGCAGAQAPRVATANGDAGPTASAQPAPATDQHQRSLQFTRCLRANGLQVSDPDPNGGGIRVRTKDQAKVDAAMEACRRYSPKLDQRKPPTPQELARLRALAACIRAHGVPSFPDPDPSGGFPAVTGPDKSKVVAAQQACKQNKR